MPFARQVTNLHISGPGDTTQANYSDHEHIKLRDHEIRQRRLHDCRGPVTFLFRSDVYLV